MPFTEMPGLVSGVSKGLGDGFFLKTEGVSVILDSRAIIGAPCQDGGSTRRAVGCSGIETIEAKAVRSHLVEVGCENVRVVVVARLTPALIVGHHEDNVRLFSGDCH